MITREIVEFIRSTPLLMQLFFVYFVLPQFGITLSAWVCGMLTIGLHFGTYAEKDDFIVKFDQVTKRYGT